MVVSRKTPAAPLPEPVSRTNSSQPIPRKHKQQQLQDQLNSEIATPPKRPKQPKPKSKPPAQKATTTFLDKLFLFSLFAFALYAALVCPSYSLSPHQAPVTCRALTSYRTHVLEPYVLPPLKSASQSPLIKPYLETTQNIHHTLRPKIVSAYRTLANTLGPWYTRAFLPRWNAYVYPHLHKLWGELARRAEPYVGVARDYATRVQRSLHLSIHRAQDAIIRNTHLDSTSRHLRAAYVNARPFLIDLSEKAQIYGYEVYVKGRKFSSEAWVKAKPHVLVWTAKAQVWAKRAVKELGDARRRYVDPHVKKILERVDGNGKSYPSPSSTQAPDTIYPSEPAPTPTDQESSTVILQDIPETPVDNHADSEGIPAIKETNEVPSATTPEDVDVASTTAPEPSVDLEVEEELRAVSVAKESAEGSVPSSVDVEEAIASPSGPAKDLEEEVGEKLNAGTVGGVAAQSTPPTDTDTDANLDLDDFLSELGVDFSSDASTTSSDEIPTEEQILQQERAREEEELETQRKQEEYKEQLAKRRAEIVGRHEEWQRKLDVLVEEQEKRVFVEVEGVRKWAVGELGVEFESEFGSDQLVRAPGLPETRYRLGEDLKKGEGLGAKVIEGLGKQGERFVRGLETYLGSLEVRRAGWVKPTDGEETPQQTEKREKTLEGETQKWEEVLNKVEDRFGKTVNEVRLEVHEWYVGVRAREGDLITEASNSIKKLAERSQADIAMDYAWLDDVTTKDWENYHELMTTYEEFLQTALAIQNGSYVPPGVFILTDAEHIALQAQPASDAPDAPLIPSALNPLSPANDPLVHALNKLQNEFNDVVLGFQLAVQGLRKKAGKVLSVDVEGEDGDGYFSVKHEKGERVDDMREYIAQQEAKAQAKEQDPEPEVSILPIGEVPREQGDDSSRVVIGKDPVVVAENLKRVGIEHQEL